MSDEQDYKDGVAAGMQRARVLLTEEERTQVDADSVADIVEVSSILMTVSKAGLVGMLSSMLLEGGLAAALAAAHKLVDFENRLAALGKPRVVPK